MAYDALRTIMPIAGWPEEGAREVQINVSDQLVTTNTVLRGFVVRRSPADAE